MNHDVISSHAGLVSCRHYKDDKISFTKIEAMVRIIKSFNCQSLEIWSTGLRVKPIERLVVAQGLINSCH